MNKKTTSQKAANVIFKNLFPSVCVKPAIWDVHALFYLGQILYKKMLATFGHIFPKCHFEFFSRFSRALCLLPLEQTRWPLPDPVCCCPTTSCFFSVYSEPIVLKKERYLFNRTKSRQHTKCLQVYPIGWGQIRPRSYLPDRQRLILTWGLRLLSFSKGTHLTKKNFHILL
jgi:hypothetical protein